MYGEIDNLNENIDTVLRQLHDYSKEEAALRSLRTKVAHYIKQLNAVVRMKIRSICVRLTVVAKTLINYCHLHFYIS